MKLGLLFLFLLSSIGYGNTFTEDLVIAVNERTQHNVRYDGAYHRIAYPNGDVPANIGVCTDVVIRSYRSLGVDLQQRVHEDMRDNFSAYPSKRIWGLANPDSNIDHRRVPNLQVFFERHGTVLPITNKAQTYKAGDIVTWMLPGNLPHIGIVVNTYAVDNKTPLIVHNIGAGPQREDVLFRYKITGHYRYEPVVNSIAGIWKHSEKPAWLEITFAADLGGITVKRHDGNSNAVGLTVIKDVIAAAKQTNLSQELQWQGKMFSAQVNGYIDVSLFLTNSTTLEIYESTDLDKQVNILTLTKEHDFSTL
ncbi:DUF1287 domain-containing protein [Pseudoalteromonas sp. NEC-BIFX-2020_015]|nr:DUF1287 domain-containing protein [Pseudoalteromonas sp. NEC-BIFX-2020_015]